MKKVNRTLSVIIAIAMTLCLLPATAFATEPNVCRIDSTEYLTITAALAAVGKNKSATIVLIDDANENITINSGRTITLDLNGHVLKGTGAGSVITNKGTLIINDSDTAARHYFNYNASGAWTQNTSANTGTSLGNITAETAVVEVTGGVITGGNSTKNGGGILNYATSANAGTLTINGGTVVGNAAAKGGGVYVARYTENDLTTTSAITINGGKIVGNLASTGGDNGYGGGIYIDGDAVINGGYIAFNTAAASAANKRAGGGGLYASTKAKLSSITGLTVNANSCLATGSSEISQGGGLCLFCDNSSAPLIISDCVIQNNLASVSGVNEANNKCRASGGGLFNNTSIVLSGETKITGNTARILTAKADDNIRNAFGGGLFIASDSDAVIDSSDVLISGNVADSTYKSQGAGVYMSESSSLTMTAGAITGNTIKAYKDETDNEEEGAGLCVTRSTSIFTVGGTAKITGNKASDDTPNNVYLRSGDNAVITIADGEADKPTTDMEIGVMTATLPTAGNPIAITANGSSSDAGRFTIDMSGCFKRFVAASAEPAVDAHFEIAVPGVVFTAAGELPGFTYGTAGTLVKIGTLKADFAEGAEAEYDYPKCFDAASEGNDVSETAPTVMIDGDNLWVGTTASTPAGDYYIEISAINKAVNPNETVTIGERIKITVNPKEVSLNWTNTSFTYNGQAQKPAAAVSGLVGSDSCTVTVIGEKTNAGTYIATASALSNQNYKLPSDATQSFTINPKVTLQQGGEVKYSAESSDLDGKFSFGTQEIEDGTYNLVAEFGDKTVTDLVKYGAGETPKTEIEVPAETVKAIVETTGENTPDVVVEGLNEVASANKEADKVVEIKLTVEAKAEGSVASEASDAIKAMAETKDKTIEYLDIQITKTVDGTPDGTIADTGSLITIIIPFKTSGRTNFEVVRYHGGTAEALTQISNEAEKADGKFMVGDGVITVYASKFSVYAIAYSQEKQETPVYSESKYRIVTDDKPEHGTVTADAISAAGGRTITLTINPEEGYTLETLTVTDENGNEIELTAKEIGKYYTFRMPSSRATVKASFMEDNSMLNIFTDVYPGSYCFDAVLWAAKNGITEGIGNGKFGPDLGCTRAQVVTFLYRAAGSPEVTTTVTFDDVVKDSYYEKAVAWAIENKITNGVGNNKFAPETVCDRAQVVTFLARFAKANGTFKNGFDDVESGSYYENAVGWALENKVTEGVGDNKFAPGKECTRGEIVTFLYRYFK